MGAAKPHKMTDAEWAVAMYGGVGDVESEAPVEPRPSPAKRAWRPRPTRDSFVYFIQGDTTGLIKIGWATEPSERLSRLQIGSAERLTLLGVIRAHRSHERGLHMRFHASRVHGEWFSPTAELMALIAADAADYDRLLHDENVGKMRSAFSRPA